MKRAHRNVVLFLPMLNFLYAMFLDPDEGPDVTALNSTMSNMALLAALVYAIVSTFIGSFSKDDLIQANSAYSSTGQYGCLDWDGSRTYGRDMASSLQWRLMVSVGFISVALICTVVSLLSLNAVVGFCSNRMIRWWKWMRWVVLLNFLFLIIGTVYATLSFVTAFQLNFPQNGFAQACEQVGWVKSHPNGSVYNCTAPDGNCLVKYNGKYFGAASLGNAHYVIYLLFVVFLITCVVIALTWSGLSVWYAKYAKHASLDPNNEHGQLVKKYEDYWTRATPQAREFFQSNPILLERYLSQCGVKDPVERFNLVAILADDDLMRELEENKKNDLKHKKHESGPPGPPGQEMLFANPQFGFDEELTMN